MMPAFDSLSYRIEEASLNAWPALQQLLYDGWVIRFANGYTKRANAVTALYQAYKEMNIGEKIAFCEQCYLKRGLPPIFRLLSFAAPAELELELERRNYTRMDETSVLYHELNGFKSNKNKMDSALLCVETLDEWLAIFCNLSESPLEQHQTHRAILQAIPATCLMVSLEDSGNKVACGIGVLEGRLLGLFDLVTGTQYRNRGYATAMIGMMLEWAQEHGARYAYLQVAGQNIAARRLYDKLGFQEAYRYWYQVGELAVKRQ